MNCVICPRYLYVLAAFVVSVIMLFDIGFCVFPVDPVLYYIVTFCFGVIICELCNLLKWVWLRYLW